MSADQLDLRADGPLDGVDFLVLSHIRQLMAQIDPVPQTLTDRVKFELSLSAMHAELAELQHLTLAGVREDSSPYAATESVTFTTSRHSLMVTFGPADEGGAPDTVRVDGWVTGPAVSIELRVGELQFRAEPDAAGRFVVENVPRGPARFVLHPHAEGERPVLTPAIEL